MTDPIDVGALYREAREQLSVFIRTLSQAQLDMPVPACPGWTVHGVISHLAGIAADAVAGRLGGVPSESHTAGQVAERTGKPTAVVLREWERSASQFELVLSRAGNSFLPPVLDIVVHEHDVRGALDLPANRDHHLVAVAADTVVERFLSRVASAGLPPVVVVEPGGPIIDGPLDAPMRLSIPRYELFRAGFGRRSARQIEARFEGGDPQPYVAHLAIFGPAASDIVE
jgi:uncharacterized protein (TIGR03083 family)